MQVCKLNGKCYGLTLACTRFTILIRGTIFNKFELLRCCEALLTENLVRGFRDVITGYNIVLSRDHLSTYSNIV